MLCRDQGCQRMMKKLLGLALEGPGKDTSRGTGEGWRDGEMEETQ